MNFLCPKLKIMRAYFTSILFLLPFFALSQQKIYWNSYCPQATYNAKAVVNTLNAVTGNTIDYPEMGYSNEKWEAVTDPSTHLITSIQPRTTNSIGAYYRFGVTTDDFEVAVIVDRRSVNGVRIISQKINTEIFIENGSYPIFNNLDENYEVIIPSVVIDRNNTGWAIAAITNYMDYSSTLKLIRFQMSTGGALTAAPQIVGNVITPNDASVEDMIVDGEGKLFALLKEYTYDANTGYFGEIMEIGTANISDYSTGDVNLVKAWEIVQQDGSPAATNSSTGEFYNGVGFIASGDGFLLGGIYSSPDVNGHFLSYLDPGNANGSQLVLSAPNTTIMLLNYCDFSDMSANTTGIIPLPVTFDKLNAFISSGRLHVNWTTAKEQHNSHFNILISKDGKTFTKAGQVDSKASSGNSSVPLQYEFSTMLNNLSSMSAVAITILLLSTIIMFYKRKKIMLPVSLMLISAAVITPACNKNNNDITTPSEGKLFVKIQQVDKDGKTSTSKVVNAVYE